MLDLNELSRKLDEALQKETSDSLINWLINQRGGNINIYVGDGNILPLQLENCEFIVKPNEFSELPNNDNTDIIGDDGHTQYSMAA